MRALWKVAYKPSNHVCDLPGGWFTKRYGTVVRCSCGKDYILVPSAEWAKDDWSHFGVWKAYDDVDIEKATAKPWYGTKPSFYED